MLSNDYLGGGKYRSMSGDYHMHSGSKRVQCVNPTTSGLSVYLPDARDLPLGGPIFAIIDIGANDVDILANDGSGVWSLSTGIGCELFLCDNSTQAGRWVVNE